MKSRHRRFEVQCVLASCGQLSAKAYEDLLEHAASCGDCAKHFEEMAALTGDLLAAGLVGHRPACAGREMTGRFVARAIREGVPLSANAGAGSRHLTFSLPAVVALALLVAFLGWRSDRTVSNPGVAESLTRKAPIGFTPPEMESSLPRLAGKGGRTGAGRKVAPGTVHKPIHPEIHPEEPAQIAKHLAELSRWTRMDARPLTLSLKLNSSAPAIPALTLWLARLDEGRTWSYPDSRKSCDEHGVFTWTREKNDNPLPPVFCFDPKISLIADSNSPESQPARWNRSGDWEGLREFRFTPDRPAFIH
jgi:hypothetical protein